MRSGSTVRPKKWSSVIDLYDDGITSLIFGIYDQKKKCLGIRWNGDSNNPKDIGFPSQGKYPLWFVLPEWIEMQILSIIRGKSCSNSKNIQIASKELGLFL